VKYIIGNWKSNQSLTQSLIWLDDLATIKPKINELKKIILCLPFTEIAAFNQRLYDLNLPIVTASQNVSHLPPGKHTGEINALMLSELVSYCIVGHSERRTEFSETSQMVAEKCRLLLENAITPIVCLDTPYLDEQIKELFRIDVEVSRCIFVYEPVSAIGTGNPISPIEANHIAKQISFMIDYASPVLYGGSVSADIVSSFVDEPDISGVLVGTDSLNPLSFAEIINQVK
jgi:triosephosphate isomerase